jgi:hypothetical protein
MVDAVPAELLTEATKEVSFPGYLVEVAIQSVSGQETVFRLSTAGKKVLVGSRYFSDHRVEFGAYDYQSVGISGLTNSSVTLSLDNSANRYAFFAFSDDAPLKDQRVRVWAISGPGEEVPDNLCVLVFEGYVDSVLSVTEAEVKFSAKAQSITAGWTPRIFLAPPMCNHLPKAGTRIGNLVLVPARR